MGKPSKLQKRCKLVVVGDGACGKTSLLAVLTEDEFPEKYIPTVFYSSVYTVTVDNKEIALALWDTAGQEDYDRLRPLSYPGSHVILLCFAVDSPDSLDNVQEKWIEELNNYAYGVPIVLVGCKTDLRSDKKTIDELGKIAQKPVSFDEGFAAAIHIGAQKYVECSAKLNEGVKKVFDVAARSASEYVEKKCTRGRGGRCICL